jgi:hypothetical protein
MAGAGHDANAHLAAAHDMYNEERYIAAGHHLELALAGGASLKDEQEDQWARRCADDAAAAVQLRDAIESSAAKASTGWKLSTDAKGIEVLYRSEPSTPILSIAAHFDVMATVKVIMMLMSECELLPTWMPPFLGLEVRRLAQPSRFRQLVYMKAWMPWPFKDREMIIDAMGVDVIDEHNGILVVIRSYDAHRDADIYGVCVCM